MTKTDLLAFLRGSAPRDVTKTPERKPQPTIGAPTGTRLPAKQKGLLAALLRSAEPSEDTPMGMVNEMFNPIRAGAQAREFVGSAADAAQGGRGGEAALLAALAAMSVPGVPGDEMAKGRRAMRELSAAPEARPYLRTPDPLMGFGRAPKGFSESKYPFTGNVLVRWPDGDAMVDQIKGMNMEQALERARRNWPGADVKPYYGPLKENPESWVP